jgi:hypothetical protein
MSWGINDKPTGQPEALITEFIKSGSGKWQLPCFPAPLFEGLRSMAKVSFGVHGSPSVF